MDRKRVRRRRQRDGRRRGPVMQGPKSDRNAYEERQGWRDETAEKTQDRSFNPWHR
jgi:hypothetical protein